MELPQSILNLELEPGQKPEIEEVKTVKLPCLRVMTEKRRGKWVTIVWSDEPLTDAVADDLSRMLKHRLAVGGSSRGGEILLQGNMRDKVVTVLKQDGYKVK